MAMRKERFQEIQSKMKYGVQRLNRYYAIVEGKVEVGVGDKKEWVAKQYVVSGGDNRSHTEELVEQFIFDNSDQIKGMRIVGIYRENR